MAALSAAAHAEFTGDLGVLEVKVDPEVPPLPPHIRFDQAKMMKAVLANDPEGAGIMGKALKGKASELKHALTRGSD